MILKRAIDWRNAWFPIDDVTYLNFAAHAAIPRAALNAVELSVAAKMRPHIVDDQSFFSVAASLRQTLATLIGASSEDIALTSGAGAGLARRVVCWRRAKRCGARGLQTMRRSWRNYSHLN
jgi:selenocysteine lyase/cysteine desulfurase